MRKGTHCCLNCRKRKIRCIYVTGAQETCQGCAAQDLTCIDQEYGISKADLNRKRDEKKRRDTELEMLICQVVQRLTVGEDDVGRTKVEDSALDALDRFRSELLPSVLSTTLKTDSTKIPYKDASDQALTYTEAPLISLLNNVVISYNVKSGTGDDVTLEDGARGSLFNEDIVRRTQGIKAIIPRSDDVSMVLASNVSGWRIWQKAFPTVLVSSSEKGTNDQIRDLVLLRSSYLLQSDNPAVIAKVMLCFALSIQTLPPDFDLRSLSCPVAQLN